MEGKILAVIDDLQTAGAIPSYEEIGFYVGVSSRGCVCTHVLALAKKGFIAKHAQASTIRLTALGAAMLPRAANRAQPLQP
jgi:hypothetical protein